MKKLLLMKNPKVFQGEKYIKTNSKKSYFEGWYFKNTNNEKGISFIPGISIDGKEKKAFIQVITDETSYYINYNINDFLFNVKPFYIKVANNIFSENEITIDIKDETQNLLIFGNIKYSNIKNIDTSILKPNIMGPFSYVPFMECNHAILTMKSRARGSLNINENKINFNDGIGYIEKDWGCSFPKSYIWCQANDFQDSKASFMISVADIPFKLFNFRGVICSLIINNKEYRFATYNNSKLIKYNIESQAINIELKKENYILSISSQNAQGMKLIAPVKGKMNKDILESISAIITVTLKRNNEVIFSDTSKNCGLEIVI